MKRYVPLAACGILLSAGCASDGRAKLLEEAYRTGKGTPAQFATDKIIRDRETGRAIRSWLGTDIPRIPEAEAERSVKALLCDIRSGLNRSRRSTVRFR